MSPICKVPVGQDTGRRLIGLQAGIAEIAFVDLVGCLIVFRDTEGAGGNALFTADALINTQADAAELSMIERLGRTDLGAGRLGTVHAAVFPE